MARIRTVKPDFFRHELLQDLEITHAGKCPMLVFAGLWGHCDKGGRFLWRPKQLKLDILPFLPFEMTEALEILESAALIARYEVAGVQYGLIPTFNDHQAIGGKEAAAPGKYPDPSGEVMETIHTRTGKQPRLQEGKGREGKGKEGNGAGSAAAVDKSESKPGAKWWISAEATMCKAKALGISTQGRSWDELKNAIREHAAA